MYIPSERGVEAVWLARVYFSVVFSFWYSARKAPKFEAEVVDDCALPPSTETITVLGWATTISFESATELLRSTLTSVESVTTILLLARRSPTVELLSALKYWTLPSTITLTVSEPALETSAADTITFDEIIVAKTTAIADTVLVNFFVIIILLRGLIIL